MPDEREEKQCWCIDPETYEVKQVTALSCEGNYWWVPEIGYAVPSSKWLFDTEMEALRAATLLLTTKQLAIGAKLKVLSKRALECLQVHN